VQIHGCREMLRLKVPKMREVRLILGEFMALFIDRVCVLNLGKNAKKSV